MANEGHTVVMEPIPKGMQATSFILKDLATGKVTIFDGSVANCHCGESTPIPHGSIQNYAKHLLNSMDGDTRVYFGIIHPIPPGQDKDKLVQELRAHLDKTGGEPSEHNIKRVPNDQK